MTLPFGLAALLAALFGFVALAYEMLWTRIYNFVSQGQGHAFGVMLGSYLLGIAAGSLLSRCWQDRNRGDAGARRRLFSRLVVAANLVAFLVAPAVSRLVVGMDWLWTLPAVTAGSALLGSLLPLLCHLAIPPDGRSGSRLAHLFLANIAGCAIGTLFTGFYLMDRLRFWQIESLLLGLAVAEAAVVAGRRRDIGLWLAALALAACSPWLHRGLYERLYYKAAYPRFHPFTQVVESRAGVIAIEAGRVVYGGGVYDGLIDVHLRSGGGLIRPFFVSAVHAHPRDLLVIGVSAGAWTRVLAANPEVERVTAVEINHGYREIIRTHPEVAGLLSDPKVELVIDDGRRWLRRHPDRRFDVIVMNTTFHWREFAGALLSREFLGVCRDHLRPDGILMWNCTGSDRAIRTGMAVFPHTMMLGSFCLGSLEPLRIDRGRWRTILSAYRINGEPVFDLTTTRGRSELADTLAGYDISGGGQSRIMNRMEMLARFGRAKVITDDDVGVEYEHSLDRHPTLQKILGFGPPG